MINTVQNEGKQCLNIKFWMLLFLLHAHTILCAIMTDEYDYKTENNATEISFIVCVFFYFALLHVEILFEIWLVMKSIDSYFFYTRYYLGL